MYGEWEGQCRWKALRSSSTFPVSGKAHSDALSFTTTFIPSLLSEWILLLCWTFRICEPWTTAQPFRYWAPVSSLECSFNWLEVQGYSKLLFLCTAIRISLTSPTKEAKSQKSSWDPPTAKCDEGLSSSDAESKYALPPNFSLPLPALGGILKNEALILNIAIK